MLRVALALVLALGLLAAAAGEGETASGAADGAEAAERPCQGSRVVKALQERGDRIE